MARGAGRVLRFSGVVEDAGGEFVRDPKAGAGAECLEDGAEGGKEVAAFGFGEAAEGAGDEVALRCGPFSGG